MAGTHVVRPSVETRKEPLTDTERAVDPRHKTHEFGEGIRLELVWLFIAVQGAELRGHRDQTCPFVCE